MSARADTDWLCQGTPAHRYPEEREPGHTERLNPGRLNAARPPCVVGAWQLQAVMTAGMRG
jgi:hypothetical protein